eukprot:359247-Chlamydomonas_euryale.AAC.8
MRRNYPGDRLGGSRTARSPTPLFPAEAKLATATTRATSAFDTTASVLSATGSCAAAHGHLRGGGALRRTRSSASPVTGSHDRAGQCRRHAVARGLSRLPVLRNAAAWLLGCATAAGGWGTVQGAAAHVQACMLAYLLAGGSLGWVMHGARNNHPSMPAWLHGCIMSCGACAGCMHPANRARGVR